MAGEERIQVRRGTTSEWQTSNPTLSNGEPGFDSSRNDLKLGDGTSAWTSLGALLPPGIIVPYGAATAPNGWLICNGQAVSRTTYKELFDIIGTTWGVGDGSTTFNVPDLRGAFLRGTGSHGTETMADGNPFAGPSVGSFEDDQMQGHSHAAGGYVAGNYGGRVGAGSTTAVAAGSTGVPVDAGNGTPRAGDETRPFSAGVTYLIKV